MQRCPAWRSLQADRLLIASIAKKEGRPMYVFARAPYYPNFQYWAEENPLRSMWTNSTTMPPEDVIEIRCWPNNPDGVFYPPVYPNAAYHIMGQFIASTLFNSTVTSEIIFLRARAHH